MALAQDSSAAAPATRRPRARPAATWQVLPDAPRLEVCGFLDPLDLLRLEMCARQNLGDGPRAFQQAAQTIPRLQLLCDKRIVSAHARLTSLYPTNMREAKLYKSPYGSDSREATSLNGFTFSWLFFWEDGSFRTAAFEHLNCRRDNKIDDAHPLRSNGDGYVFEVPDDASGQGIMAPLLLKSQEFVDDSDAARYVIEPFRKSWTTTTQLYCTRKRDGAVCKVLHINGCADGYLNEFDRPDLGSICLESYDGHGTQLLLGQANTHLEVYILFDSTNGRLRDIKLSMDTGNADENPLKPGTFRALLDAECDKESLIWALRRDPTLHD